MRNICLRSRDSAAPVMGNGLEVGDNKLISFEGSHLEPNFDYLHVFKVDCSNVHLNCIPDLFSYFSSNDVSQ